MRKIILSLLASILVLTLSSCGVLTVTENNEKTNDDFTQTDDEKTINDASDANSSQSSNDDYVMEEKYDDISFPGITTTDYFQINIESINTSKEIRPSKTNGLYNYKRADNGKQYCYIKGTIKNVSGSSHQVSFLGDFIFENRYTYSGLLLKEVDNGIDNILLYETIQPLEQIKFYYACCIPDETVNSYNSAEIKFKVISDLYDSFGDTKYNKYSLKFSK